MHVSRRTTLSCLLAFALTVQCFAADLSAKQHQRAVEANLLLQSEIAGEAADGMALTEQMRVLHVPGVSIAMIHKGVVEWSKGYGVASLGGAPVTPATVFSAASMSKPLVAVAVLHLVQIGKVQLDAPVNTYLKRWKIPENKFTAGHPVTIRQLLSHTSGIGTHDGQIAAPDTGIPTLLQVLEGQKPATTAPVRVEAQPGSKFAYANGGYVVLQLLIEEVSSKPFAQYMNETVLDPLQMTSSTFALQLSPTQQKRTATGYWEDGRHGIPPDRFVNTQSAAGGLWTTATDYAKFILELQRAYAGTSHRLLTQAMAKEMLTAGMGASPAFRWGLGVRVGGSSSAPYFEHGGSGVFQTESIGYLNGDGIVILTNGGGGGNLVDEIARSASRVYRWPDFRPDVHTRFAMPPSDLDKFVGTYGFIRITREGDHLMAEIPVPSEKGPIFPESPDQFFLQDAPTTLKFDLDEKNQCTGVEFITSVVHRHLDRTK